MSDDIFRSPPLGGPYVPPPKIEIDAAEYMALKTIVMILASLSAAKYEEQTGHQAQEWINNVATQAAGAISTSTTENISKEREDRLKERAISAINHILGGIKFPPIEGSN